MKVMEAGLGPSCSGEQILWADSIVERRHFVPQIDGVLDCHRPKSNVSDLRPMDRCVDQHSSGDGHDCLDGSFGMTIVVMGTSAGEATGLREG
jgi:hypothetical protein